MGSDEIIARFEAERQALALMDHPNIARVLDAGTEEGSGLPYFVMELVDGKSITEYCDDKKLSTRARLELFMQVCQAIQHAHQKGIVHRDIKPPNVLVTVIDDKATPKVIDFGIAKAMGPALTDKTLFTTAGQIIGTPNYMSPEQAEFNPIDIDTRSDIYSLGVLLYELLSGKTPHDPAKLKQAGLEEVLRIVREDEPPKPSTLVGKIEPNTAETVANRRGTKVEKLTHALRGDLDWIVMKAIEKDRSRRYETANAFAVDIGRFLNDELVEASPPSAIYRVRKFAKRNRGLLAATSGVALVLIAGIVMSTREAIRANRAEEEALTARADAEKLITYMMDDLSGKLKKVGKLELMEGVENAVGEYFEHSSDTGAVRKISTGGKASNLLKKSETYRKQGRVSNAIEVASEAAAIYQILYNKESEKHLFDLTNALRIKSELQLLARNISSASETRRFALGLFESMEESHVKSKEELSVYARLLTGDATYLYAQDREFEKAQKRMRAALRIMLDLVLQNPDWDEAKIWYARARYVGAYDLELGLTSGWADFSEAGNSQELLMEVVNKNPNDYRLRAEVIRNLIYSLPFGESLIRIIALAKKGEGLDPVVLAQELVTHDPSNLEWENLLCVAYLQVGYHLAEGDRKEASLPYLDKAIEALEDLNKTEVGESTISVLGEAYSERGFARHVLGDQEGAVADYNRGIEILEAKMGLVRSDANWANQLAELHFRLASELDDNSEAVRHLQKAKEIMEPVVDKMPDHSWANRTLMYIQNGLARQKEKQGDYEGAAIYLEEALAICAHFESTQTAWDWRYANMQGRASINAQRLGDWERAIDLRSSEFDRRKHFLTNEREDDIAITIKSLTASMNYLCLLATEHKPDLLITLAKEMPFIEERIGSVLESSPHLGNTYESVARLYRNLYAGFSKGGDFEKSEAFILKAINWQEKLCNMPDKDLLNNHRVLASYHWTLVNFYRQQKREQESLPHYHSTIEARRVAFDNGDLKESASIVSALYSTAKLEEKFGFVEESVITRRKIFEIYAATPVETYKSWSAIAKGIIPAAWELEGLHHEKKKQWAKAEDSYQKSLKFWLEPGVQSYGEISGRIMATRAKVRLASLYAKTKRGTDPQRYQWCREVLETLQVEEDKGTLSSNLKWVFNSSQAVLKNQRKKSE
ncbi:MAG: serine/threonine protein kinase [Verrucomicrobia bacterium]|nr:serine/threonine protein kinase [Verrucomicrobiota bacterium]